MFVRIRCYEDPIPLVITLSRLMSGYFCLNPRQSELGWGDQVTEGEQTHDLAIALYFSRAAGNLADLLTQGKG